MASFPFDPAEVDPLTTRDGCMHLKDQALSLSLYAPTMSDERLCYAQYAKINTEKNFKKNGFPERLFKSHFGDFVCRNEQDQKLKDRLLTYCEGINKGYSMGTPSFAMYGPPGTGKTFAAVCVAKEASWNRFIPAYVTVSSLAREVRSTFRRGSEESEESILKKYSEFGLLVVDEIGAGTGSDHERAMFTDVISERYNAKRPTILISNLDLNDFKEALGERVTDRMSEDGGFILPVLGASRRRE